MAIIASANSPFIPHKQDDSLLDTEYQAIDCVGTLASDHLDQTALSGESDENIGAGTTEGANTDATPRVRFNDIVKAKTEGTWGRGDRGTGEVSQRKSEHNGYTSHTEPLAQYGGTNSSVVTEHSLALAFMNQIADDINKDLASVKQGLNQEGDVSSEAYLQGLKDYCS